MTNEDIAELIEILNKRKIITTNGCWDLDLSATEKGYLKIKFKKERPYIHRISAAYYLNLDYNDKNQFALHKNNCNNKRCWNYAHLYVGTAADNFEDALKMHPNMHAKGKQTHCINGHEYTKKNTRWFDSGRFRQCKECARLNQIRYKKEKREKRALIKTIKCPTS